MYLAEKRRGRGIKYGIEEGRRAAALLADKLRTRRYQAKFAAQKGILSNPLTEFSKEF